MSRSELKKRTNYHRLVNDILTVFVILIALYIAALPLWPQVKWHLRDKESVVFYGNGSDSESQPEVKKSIPTDNRIVIPSALIDDPIIEGSHLGVINDGGAWRKNLWVESPKDKGNTVIVGHRFTYNDPEAPFYNLDKVKTGDKLAVYWQGEELLYSIREIKEVEATAIEIENNTSDRQLTIYTCTPILTAKNRLVIIADPLPSTHMDTEEVKP